MPQTPRFLKTPPKETTTPEERVEGCFSEIEPDSSLFLCQDVAPEALVDQVLLDRLLIAHAREVDYARSAASLVRQAIERRESRREACLLRVAQALQGVVLLLSVLMIAFNYHVFSLHYLSSTPMDQTRMILSLAMTVLAAALSLGAPRVADLEARIRSWITGVRRAPTLMDILLLRFQTLGILALTLILIH